MNRRLVVTTLLVLGAQPLVGQDVTPCLRVGFGAWEPPLDWQAAGHRDSASSVGARDRAVRDSVFDGTATASGRDEMRWSEGGRQLMLFPPWWPVGVVVTFDSSAMTLARGDTMTGRATALVADLRRPPPRAVARVARAGC